jgi:hypothetical protein
MTFMETLATRLDGPILVKPGYWATSGVVP